MSSSAFWSTHGAHSEYKGNFSEIHVGWALSFPERDQDDLSVRYRKLDALTIAELRSGSVNGQRARTDGEPQIGVLVNLSGRLICRTLESGEIALEPNELLVWDTEQAATFEASGPHREFYLLLPRDRASSRIADLASRSRLSVRPGSGLAAVAADQLAAIMRELDNLTDTTLAMTCQSFFDLLDAALRTPAQQPLTKTSLLLRIRQHIEDNLGDPELCPDSIAAAHGVSLRTLHATFAGTGTTVGRWLRDRRLRACYRELVRTGGSQTVTDVAYRWGFNDAAHFSRAFKEAFGITPSSLLMRSRGSLPPSLLEDLAIPKAG